MIAVSYKEFEDHGCIRCGCGFCYNNTGISGYGVVLPVKCRECEEEFIILANGLKQSNIGFGTDKKDSKGNTIFEYPKLQPHPRRGIDKHEFVRPDLRPEDRIGEFCSPTGVSYGYDLECFVKSKEAGERIVNMFNNVRSEYNNENCFSCRLDFRPSEPLGIKVKIGYEKNNEKNSVVLYKNLLEDGIVTEDKIREARNIEWNFANMWKYITKDKIWNIVNKDLMGFLLKNPKTITQEDKDAVIHQLENTKNQLAMFEIYGMYLQVNKELEKQNFDMAARVVEHTISNLDSTLYEDIQEKDVYQVLLQEYLKQDLEELIQAHKSSKESKGKTKGLVKKEGFKSGGKK